MTFDGHAFQDGFRMPLGSRPEPAAGAEMLFACGGNMISRRERLLDLGGVRRRLLRLSRRRRLRLAHVDQRLTAPLRAARRGPPCLERDEQPPRRLRARRPLRAQRAADRDEELRDLQDSARRDPASTYLHRLHHYATTRNPNARELTREPFGVDVAAAQARPARTGEAQVRGTPPLAAIDDPLTAMQFRAFDWIMRNEANRGEARRACSRCGSAATREIFDELPAALRADLSG